MRGEDRQRSHELRLVRERLRNDEHEQRTLLPEGPVCLRLQAWVRPLRSRHIEGLRDGPDRERDCGKCGHDCLGATCGAGGKCGVLVLANGERNPSGLALHGTSLYFSVYSGNAIKRVPKDNKCPGGAPCPSVVLDSTQGVSDPLAIATDGTNLFWSNFGRVQMARIDGNGAKEIGYTVGALHGMLALGAGKVWWTANQNIYIDGAPRQPRVSRANIDGTQPASFASDDGTNESVGIAVDATHVYWADFKAGKLFKRGINEGPCTHAESCGVLASVESPWALALDGQDVYFTSNSGKIQRSRRMAGP